jgi:hypothetical protein
VSVQHELVRRVSVEAGYTRRWWGNFFVTDNLLTTLPTYETYSLDSTTRQSAWGWRYGDASWPSLRRRPRAGAQSYMTSEKDLRRRSHVLLARRRLHRDGTACQRLTVQGGTSTGRAVRNNCAVTKALPELLGTARVDSCDVTEAWTTSFRGLASYTVPKIGVLVSASMRSISTTPAAGVATNGLSLAANYVVPNTIIQQSLGRLPANALATGTTTVNLLNPGLLYSLDRSTWSTCGLRRSSASAAGARTSGSISTTCSTRT